jgi:hypothetical protein
MGLRISVGHAGGVLCPSFKPGISTFTAIHINGLHRIHVDFCGCDDSTVQPWQQLMHAQLWPATVTDPQTVATFECLRQFEKVNCSGHITATDYYRALAHMTDCTGLTELPVSPELDSVIVSILTSQPGPGASVHAYDKAVGALEDDEAIRTLRQTWRCGWDCSRQACSPMPLVSYRRGQLASWLAAVPAATPVSFPIRITGQVTHTLAQFSVPSPLGSGRKFPSQ